jgi:hypothetical protein
VVQSREVNHLEGECLGAVVSCVSKSDRKSDLPEWDELLAQDYFIERVRPCVEQIPTQPLVGVEVHEVEATASIHEGLSEPGHPDQRINYEGEPSRLRGSIQVITVLTSQHVSLSLRWDSWGWVR